MGFATNALGKVSEWLGTGFIAASPGSWRSVPAAQPEPMAAPPPENEPPPPSAPAGPTPADRVSLLTALWGDGYCTPGGTEETQRLVRPMGLNQNHSFAHLGAGLGGPARMVATQIGAWVHGWEPDPDLAAVAAAGSAKAGLHKRAAIQHLNFDALELGETAFHHCLVQDVMTRSPNPTGLIRDVARALKPGGHLVMVDLAFGADRVPAEDPALQAWLRCIPFQPSLAPADYTTRFLQRIGLDLRISEEITERHQKQILASWVGHVATLRKKRPNRPQALILVAEAELWLRRCALLDAGKLRLMRWHAIKPVNWRG